MMKNLIFIFFLFSFNGVAQSKSRAKVKRSSPTTFPQSFIGDWKGKLNWYSNGGKVQTVTMEMHIKATDTTNQYTWQIVYGNSTKLTTADNRPYILKKIDTLDEHWEIDELNGIVLDSYWLGNRFSGVFTVQGNTILDSYWLENGDMHIEFFSYKQSALTTTGNGTAESPKVDSYKMGSYQKAVLKKMKSSTK
jgi:hypothetical protein